MQIDVYSCFSLKPELFRMSCKNTNYLIKPEISGARTVRQVRVGDAGPGRHRNRKRRVNEYVAQAGGRLKSKIT